METRRTLGEILTLTCKAVGLAMGVTVIVLSLLGTAPVEAQLILLAIGLFALGLAALS